MSEWKHMPVSVNGAPRSGTSWFGQILNSSPHVAYRYQPLFSYTHKAALSNNSSLADMHRFYQDILNTQDKFVLQKDGDYHVDDLVFDKAKEPTHLIYKNVRYHDILPHLLAQDPQMHLIPMIRDPRGAIHSWWRAPREFKKDWELNEEWLLAEKGNQGRNEDFFGFNKWKMAARIFLDLANDHPERVHLLRYEDLHKDPMGVSEEMFKSIDLPFEANTRSFIKASGAQHNAKATSVIRSGHDQRSWEGSLPKHIVEAMENDLASTDLEQFLDEN